LTLFFLMKGEVISWFTSAGLWYTARNILFGIASINPQDISYCFKKPDDRNRVVSIIPYVSLLVRNPLPVSPILMLISI
jgi:hypothetical protein